MRHGASLIVALEGISRPAFLIARELSQNSRSGLTVRFLSKKLELPEEEVEYLVDVNHRFLFGDLTRVKLVPEGLTAVKRILAGLENRGDVSSLFRLVKTCGPHEFRRLEERIGIDKPGGKKAAAEALVQHCYHHPDSIVEFVANGEFSPTAQEVFDVILQSKDGVLPASRVRAAYAGPDYDAEEALFELFQGFALFEMFRFDNEERLVRIAGLLSEMRQGRNKSTARCAKKVQLKPVRTKPFQTDCRGLGFSERVCRLVAAIAAKPVRVRGDGDLFREDRRRLDEISEDDDPSIDACLWVAQGAKWLVRVENELHAGQFEALINLDRVGRHRTLFEWFSANGDATGSWRLLTESIDDMKPGAWYSVDEFIQHIRRRIAENERPVLRNTGGSWRYTRPGAGSLERDLVRSLQESLVWLGIADLGENDDGAVFRISNLGRALLTGTGFDKLSNEFPERGAEIVMQPNFDIVVPLQDVDPLLTVPLDQFAELTSTSQAAVYHLSKESFTRAVQEGHDANAFVEFLMTHNRGGALPSNVVATLEDWRGGMKHVRLRTVHVLETDDPLVMADLAHRRRFGKHFSDIDPRRTIVYSDISKAKLMKELEKEGFVVG